MLQDLISLTESLAFEEDYASLYLHRAEEGPEPEQIQLLLKLTLEDDSCQEWSVTCSKAHSHKIVLGWVDSIEIVSEQDDHVLLWPYLKPSHTLWFNGVPRNAAEVVGELWQTHHGLTNGWFDFTHFINRSSNIIELLKGGHGQFAKGPEPLIDAYRQVLQKHGVRTSQLLPPQNTWSKKSVNNLQILFLTPAYGKPSYVIADDIQAGRIK